MQREKITKTENKTMWVVLIIIYILTLLAIIY